MKTKQTILNNEYNLDYVEQDFTPYGAHKGEKFKYVFGEERYAIGDMGTLISLLGKNPRRIQTKLYTGDKYLNVTLMRDGKRKKERIHRLVALHFVPRTREEATDVNHIDGDKRNNAKENLEWVTHRENIQHAMETGLLLANKSVYELIDEEGNHLDTVIGLDGLIEAWDYQGELERSVENRISRDELKFFQGMAAVKLGSVKEVYGEEGTNQIIQIINNSRE